MNTSFGILSTEHPWNSAHGLRSSTGEQRRARKDGTWHYSLAPESPLHSDDDRDSVLSIQAKETDYVRDTSDTGSYDGSSDEWEEPVEYEPATESEKEAPMHDSDTAEDTDKDIITTKVISVDVVEEAEAFADSEQSDAPSDPELGPNDYWKCAQCRNSNNNPLYRYCEKCFKVRKNFFPPRPKRKSTKEIKIDERRNEIIKPTLLANQSPCESRSGSQTDSGFDSAYNSQETLPSQETKETEESVNLGVNPNVILGRKRSNEDDERANKRLRTSSSSQVNNNMCIICCSEPKSGVFVHGRIAHICCCYKCAVKVWATVKRCPVCNCKVSNVLKAVVM